MTTLDAMATDPASKPPEGRHPPKEPDVPDESHMSAMDYAEHERTYEGFLRLTKWGVIVVVAVLVLMAVFLT